MFELKYTQHGEPDKDTLGQARALVAALVAIHGEHVLPDRAPHYGGMLVNNLVQARAAQSVANVVTGLASDGEPMVAPPTEPAQTGDDEGTEEPTRDLDANGIPWDERIHSGTKKQNKDGTWARRRNTDDAVYEQVMAELKAAHVALVGDGQTPEGDSAASAFGTPAPPAVPVPPAPPAAAAPPAPAPAPAPAPPAAPAPAPPAAAVDVSFPAIMRTVTELQRDGKIDRAGVNEVLGQMGVASIGLLVTASEDVRAGVAALLEARK